MGIFYPKLTLDKGRYAMKLELTLQQLIPQIRKRFAKWLIVSVVAGLLVLGLHYLSLPERNHVVGVINFSFPGIESGHSPIGNRFDPDEMRHDATGVPRSLLHPP